MERATILRRARRVAAGAGRYLETHLLRTVALTVGVGYVLGKVLRRG